MFTGLVATAKVEKIVMKAGDAQISIRPDEAISDLVKGESIAINGACLTVESFDDYTFTAFASAETLKVTNLGQLKSGALVNMERALAFGDRLGGHLVSGHVDGVAVVEQVSDAGQSKKFRISLPQDFSQQIIPKGSITLDGISLTVNLCGPGFLEVNIIPETQSATTISEWRKGRVLNFETDLIGKYVQAFIDPETKPKTGLTIESLKANGF